MYFTSGSDRAFEQLMQTRPGADHFDNGEAGAPEDCGTCRFYRPHWKYQFCVYEECPYQPGKLTALDGAVKFQVKGVDDEMAVFRVEKNRGYLVTSVAPIPMATMMGKEWGGMGQNYIRSLLALGFQAFLIIVCVAIYAVLVQNIAVVDDISNAIWTCMGYTVLLCFCLFKTSSLAKSVFNAH